MEKFLSQLMNVDDLEINHNEYFEIDESKIENIDDEEITKKIIRNIGSYKLDPH